MDARRREAERAAAQGDVQARARLISQRLRSGELDRDRTFLAALADDPAAREVLGAEAPPPELQFPRWIRRLLHGQPVERRVELALARCALPAWEASLPRAPQPRQAIDAFGAWLESADDAGWDGFREAAHEASRAGENVRLVAGIIAECATDHIPTVEELERDPRWIEWQPVGDLALTHLGLEVEQALEVVRKACSGPQGEASLTVLVESAFLPVRRVARILRFAGGFEHVPAGPSARPRMLARHAQRVAREVGAERVREAIRGELVPWVLEEDGD